MKKSKKIDKLASLDKLEYIRKNVTENLDEKRIVAAVNTIKREDTVSTFLQLFAGMNINFAEETDSLLEKSRNYNKLYATSYNGRFGIAYQSLTEIKKQVFFLYRLLNVGSNKPNSQDGFICTNTSSIEYHVEHTIMGNQPYMEYMFDNMSETQKRLVHEIKSFLTYLDGNLRLCEEIIVEEQMIGSDENLTYELFMRQLDDVLAYVKDTRKKKPQNTNEKYYIDLLKARQDPSVTKEWFHGIQPKHLCNVACGIMDEELSQYTPLERKTFEEDLYKLHKYKTTMSHLDDVVTKITGDVMCYVYNYCECNAPQAAFHRCFKETYTVCGGHMNIVSGVRFNQASTTFGQKNNQEYLKFRLKMDGFMSDSSYD